MCPMKACTNLPHPIFLIYFQNLFVKTNIDLIGQVCSSSVDGGSFFMVNFENVHPNVEEESRKLMIWKKFRWPSQNAFF